MASDLFRLRPKVLGGLIALSLLGLATVPAIAAGMEVKVEMWDKQDGMQGMTLSTDRVKTGTVTFKVTNVSKSEQEHEFLVAKTDLMPDKLSFVQGGARVDESKLPGLKELGDLEPGQSRSMTLNMTPGKYLLFCNEEGHVKAGMWANVTVTP
jgi:uncharacterized cupredoxin-like copper-binding protein